MTSSADWQVLFPYAVIAGVLVLRWRTINRPRVLRPALLIALPLVMAMVAGLVLFTLPPAQWALPVLLTGLALGAVAGWQRSRLMRLERDPESGQVMVRNSPLALLLVLGLLAGRRLLLWEAGVSPGADLRHSLPALLALYASLGFAVGLVWASRIELWRRARALA
ncbi:DUF1453 family protein [Novosphingobium flavum]|uniref:CcdC protein domain-containing protein n=1 Tax=Novosphingobium aerophilum TaxID=2839843 RepID=UPI001639B8C7|nr:DUF1453 family protein [Novosphingobium aerophilum]